MEGGKPIFLIFLFHFSFFFRDAEHYGFSSLTITNSSFLDMEYYFNDILEPQFSVIFTRGPKRQGTKGNEEEKEDENQDEGNMGKF